MRPDVLFKASDVNRMLPKMKKLLDFLAKDGEEEKKYFKKSFGNLTEAALSFDENGVPKLEKAPIVIYEGKNICYDVLNSFARELGAALKNSGEEVEYIDLTAEDSTE